MLFSLGSVQRSREELPNGQKNSPAQVSETARSDTEHSDSAPDREDYLGQGSLAVELWDKEMGVGHGALEVIC